MRNTTDTEQAQACVDALKPLAVVAEKILRERAYTFNEFHIPPHMMDGLRLYIKFGVHPGGFLSAVISNDLMEACGRADVENMRNLPAYAAYLWNEAPAPCWGSTEKMVAWIHRFERAERERNAEAQEPWEGAAETDSEGRE